MRQQGRHLQFTADVSAVDSLENKTEPDPLGPAELYGDES